MAKVPVSVEGTKFDHLADLKNSVAALGLNTNTQKPDTFSLESQGDRLNSFSNVDVSQFERQIGGQDVSLFSNDSQATDLLTESRAQNQSKGEQLFKGLGRIGVTIGTEILKVPGYVGGAVAAGVEKAIDPNKSVMGTMVDNAWVNAFETLDQNLKDAMPVYLAKDVAEGGITDKLASPAWWSTTGADGIGFLISMYGPGLVTKGLRVGELVAKGLEAAGQSSKFLGKTLTAANILSKGELGAVTATSKLIGNVESGVSIGANTFIESASEAANTFDNVKADFMKQHPDATPEEAQLAAGTAASHVFKTNMALLVLSNTFDELTLFKGFNQTADKIASEGLIGKLFKNGVLDIEAAKKTNWLSAIGKGVKNLGASGVKEGLFEEGLQFELQNHYENVANGKTKAGFMEDIVYNYFEDLFTSPEMQESVVLGSILGGGASLIGNAVQKKREKEILFGRAATGAPSFLGRVMNRKQKDAQPGLANILQDNFINSFRTITDIAQLDANGQIVTQNGKPVIDEAKLKEAIEQKEKLVALNQLHNIAILEGNKTEEEMYGNMLSFNYFMPFLQQEGGYEVLKAHIAEQMTDLMVRKAEEAGIVISDEQKEKTKGILLDKAKRYNDMYMETKTTNNTELSVPRSKENAPVYDAWKSNVFNKRMQALIQHDTITKMLNDAKTKFMQFIGPDGQIRSDIDTDNMSPVELVKLELYKQQRVQLEDVQKKAKDEYLSLSNRKGLKQSFEDYKTELKELEEAAVAADQEDNVDTVKDIQKIMTEDEFLDSVVNAGYPTVKNSNIKGEYIKDEKIVVENNKGGRFTLQSVYDPKAKRVDHLLVDKSGNVTKVTDANGNFTEAFLKQGFKPISKVQISAERKALAIRDHKRAQLKLIDEIITHKTNEITNSKEELESINKQIQDFEKEYKSQKEQIDKYYLKNVAGKPDAAKQTKYRLKTMRKLLSTVEQTLANLQSRKQYLESRVVKLTLFIDEYNRFKTEVVGLQQFSISTEAKNTNKQVLDAIKDLTKDVVLSEDITNIQDQLNKSIELIQQYNLKIIELQNVRDSIINVIKAHEALMQMISANKKDLNKAVEELNKLFGNIILPYNLQKIADTVRNEPHNVLAGETLTKNNIVTNAQAIAEYFENPANQAEKIRIFNQANQLITDDTFNDIYDLIKSVFAKYTATDQQIQTQHGYSPDEMFELAESLLITKREIADLKKQIEKEQASIPVLELQKRYIVLNELMLQKVNNRFQQIKKEQELAGVDSSQKQIFNSEAEPVESQAKPIQSGKLSPTEYSTTGRNTATTGKEDELDENGYPQLNANEFQRTWFKTIDKLAGDISEYRFVPYHASYDEATTDEVQQQINANNPNSRGDRDIFVILVDRNNVPVKVDQQGNFIKSGTIAMTSLRSSEEMFGADLKIIPDNILNNYLNDIGLPDKVDFAKAKNEKKTINDIIKSKKGKDKFKNELDSPVEDLLNQAVANAKLKYDAFIDNIIASNKKGEQVYIPIEGITKGFALYQMKDGKRVKSKPLSVIPELVLNKDFGTKQLQGGKLGLVINQKVKIGDKFVDMEPGTVYLQLEDGTTTTLDSRTINKDEVNTVMYLLSLANGNTPLNTVNVPFPTKKNGEKYYYFFNGKKMENVIPVFYRKLKDSTDTFSLLHSLINYGAKGKDKNKKGEIYIQSGNVVYTTFDNETRQVSLVDLNAAVQEGKFNNYNDSVTALNEFLLTKRFNVNKVLIGNNPIFMYPKLKKDSQGYTVDFDTHNTYYSFLVNNVLTTTMVAPTVNHPRFLQRNVIYKPELVKQQSNPATTTTEAAKPKEPAKPKVKKQDTSLPMTAVSEDLSTLEPKLQSVVNVLVGKLEGAVAKMKAADPTVNVAERMNAKKEPTLDNEVAVTYRLLIEDGNGTSPYSEVQIRDALTKAFDSVVAKYSTPVVEEKTEEVTPEKTTPPSGPVSLSDKLRQKAQAPTVTKTPRISTKKPADKIMDTDKLIESLVNKQIIDKQCK